MGIVRFALVILLLAVVPLHAESKTVTGIVLDGEGRPIVGASIEPVSDITRDDIRTDEQGRFQVVTRESFVAIRKAGYRSVMFSPSQTGGNAILRRVAADGRLPRCPRGVTTTGIDGWHAILRFPASRDIRASRQGADVDFGMRTYSLATSGTQAMHGSGPLWTLGYPTRAVILGLAGYEEITYTDGSLPIYDYRGRDAKGMWLRQIERLGESVYYSVSNEAEAKALDAFFDGVCVAGPQQR